MSNENRRAFLLAELRCALLRARLACADIEATGLALQCRLVSPEGAVQMLWGSTAQDYLGFAEAGSE